MNEIKFCALNSPWILLARAVASIERNHFILINGRLANWAQLAIGACQQPLMQAGPAEEMAAHADYRILGCVQTDIALVQRFIVLLLLPLLLLLLFVFVVASVAAVAVLIAGNSCCASLIEICNIAAGQGAAREGIRCCTLTQLRCV